MKYLSRLAALLCVMALFACGAAADTLPLTDTLDSYSIAVLAANIAVNGAVEELYDAMMSAETLKDMHDTMMREEYRSYMYEMSVEQLKTIYEHMRDIYAALENITEDDGDYYELLADTFIVLAEDNDLVLLAETDYSVMVYQGSTIKKGYNNLYLAIDDLNSGAVSGDTIIIQRNISESGSRIIKKNVTIKAKVGTSPVVTWTAVHFESVIGYRHALSSREYTGKNGKKYNQDTQTCLMIDDGVVVHLGGANSGSLTFTTNQTARIIKSSGTLNVHEGISIKGGRPYGWNTTINGAGIYVYAGTLNMDGGLITDNKSIGGGGTEHCGVGGGGGVTIASNARFNFSGGTISNNEAGSGGGGGILVQDRGASLVMSGGTLDGNFTNVSSGGGIAVNPGGSAVITNGTMKSNHASNLGGGLFARGGDGAATLTNTLTSRNVALYIGGNTLIESNTANSGGGGVLFWTTGGLENITDNTIEIGGNARIINNTAPNGGGIQVGREVKETAIGDKAKLVLSGSPTISNNTASINGGGIYMQPDRLSSSVNDVVINGGTISENTALNGGGIYVPGGTVEMSSGLFEENSANAGGALYIENGTFTMNNGSMDNNEADEDGGAVYITGGSLTMKTGTMSNNTAGGNGGAAYVAKGSSMATWQFDMTDGTLNSNTAANGGAVYVDGGNFRMSDGELEQNNATADGGAVYVSGGSFSMTTGTMNNNTAGGNGGAAYVSGGNFEMMHGTVDENTAKNGGAVYVNAGEMKIESGTMMNNTAVASSTQKAEDGEEGYGGAVFANGGSIYVGKLNCTQANPITPHKNDPYTHPVVKENTAVFGGGLAVRGGKVYLYCCDMTENVSSGQGTGMNVFMDENATTNKGGEVWHYIDGAIIGDTTNHGIVSIGGSLTVKDENGNAATVEIVYHSNYRVDLSWEGTAPEGYYLNLPYCPTTWETEQSANQLTFVGWANTGEQLYASDVRKPEHLNAVGSPVPITGTDGVIHFYAIWAPETNNIIYAYAIADEEPVTARTSNSDFELGANSPTSYKFNLSQETIALPTPAKAGYTFMGWKMYASLQTMSNWNADTTDPAKADPITQFQYLPKTEWNESESIQTALVTEQNFGDIVLVAVFKPAFSGLRIVKAIDGTDSAEQNFIFKITGKPDNTTLEWVDMYVTIAAGDSQVIYLPVGRYWVDEVENWSWRYDLSKVEQNNDIPMPMTLRMRSNTEPVDPRNVVISDPSVGVQLTFTNKRVESKWLDGNAISENELKGANGN